MESNVKVQFKIGLFLSGGLILILGSIFMLGADKAFFKRYATYHAQFDQVQGLAEGSVISLAGITVGNIRSIQIVDQNLIDVTMDIDETYTSRLTDGTKVEIRTQGALGDKYIYIIPGVKNESALKEGSVVETAKASDIMGIISERGNEAEKIFDIINEIHHFTKALNSQNRAEKIMASLDSATTKIEKAAGATLRVAEELNGGNLKSSLEHLNSVVTKLDHGQGTLGALINDSSLHDQLKSMLGASSRKSTMKTLLRTSIEKSEEKNP